MGIIAGIPFGIIGSQVGVPERYNLDVSKNSTEKYSEISGYFKADEYNDEIEPIPDTEVEPPILQSDGNYKFNVSSMKWRKHDIIITWHDKRIYLQKSDVVNSWKSGDKSYIIIPAKIYENEFLGE